MKLTDATTRVRQNLKDTALSGSGAQLLSDTEITSQLSGAVNTYSQTRPQLKVKEYTGDGSTYDFTLPTDWEDEFSMIIGGMNEKIEYPAGEQVPTFIEDEDWMIYDLTSPKKLRLINDSPSSTEKVRIRYTIRHYLNNESTPTSIPDADFDAVLALATAYCCDILATQSAGSTDSTISADSVNYRDSQLRYSQQATAWREKYRDHMGIDKDGGPAAAGASADMDLDPSWKSQGYGDFVTHPKANR